MKTSRLILFFAFIVAAACSSPKNKYPDLEDGRIERNDPSINLIIPEDVRIEVIAEGHEWTEGPVWVEELNALLYSDIPRNAIYSWNDNLGADIYLQPSGFMGENFSGSEPGSNGLILDADSALVMCQHGERRIARMTRYVGDPAPEFEVLVDNYQGKRLNSPNDLDFHSSGDLYFTDPPYGLPERMEDPEKELDFQGVYLLRDSGELVLLTDTLTRPNGIGLSPDESKLYVANSDFDWPVWLAFDINENGTVSNGRELFRAETEKGPGVPDGMTVHSSGNLFASGPGGIWIISPEGELLGNIYTGRATANCTFNDDESVLYITADDLVLRIVLMPNR